MSNSNKHPKNKSNHAKRLSRSTHNSDVEEQGKQTTQSTSKQAASKTSKDKLVGSGSKSRRVLTTVLAVILIAAFAVPSISVLTYCSDSGSSSTTISDETYMAAAEEALAAVEEDSEDMDAKLTLADAYYDWAMVILQGIVTSSDMTSDELFSLAIDYYSEYLESEDSVDAAISMSMCQYYLDDFEGAQSTLESAIESHEDSAMAWARLGLVRVALGETDSAKEAFNYAMELDPDDEEGAYSYAEEQLSLLE